MENHERERILAIKAVGYKKYIDEKGAIEVYNKYIEYEKKGNIIEMKSIKLAFDMIEERSTASITEKTNKVFTSNKLRTKEGVKTNENEKLSNFDFFIKKTLDFNIKK